jgi:hypothetical protein
MFEQSLAQARPFATRGGESSQWTFYRRGEEETSFAEVRMAAGKNR